MRKHIDAGSALKGDRVEFAGIEYEVINKSDSQHMHGMCHPLNALDSKDINTVVCGGMGARAVQKLNEGGIKAYRANAGTVEEIIKKYKEGKLKEITVDNACINHSCH